MRSEKRIKPFMKYIEDTWKANPDQRFGQLLVNLGFVEDSLKTWQAEMSDYPLPHEIMRNIQTWGTNGKHGGGKYEEKYISELETSHIKAILKTQKHIKGTSIETILKNELKLRERIKNRMGAKNDKVHKRTK